MIKFKKGDKVRMLRESDDLIKGEIITIDGDDCLYPWITKTYSSGGRLCIAQDSAELVIQTEDPCEVSSTVLNRGTTGHIEARARYESVLTNKTNNKMTSIKETLKRLTLTKPEKQFVEAGLMYTDKSWEAEAKDFAREQMLESHMATKEFKDELLKVAEARIADRK